MIVLLDEPAIFLVMYTLAKIVSIQLKVFKRMI